MSKSIITLLITFLLVAPLPVLSRAQDSTGPSELSDLPRYQLYFRACGGIGLNYQLQGTNSTTVSDPDSPSGTRSNKEAEAIYKADDAGRGLSVEAGLSWNPDYLLGMDTRWKGRSILQGGPALTFRYVQSDESNITHIGMVLDTTVLWVIQFYIGAMYGSFESPMYYAADYSYELSGPVLAKKSLGGIGLIIGGGIDYPVTENLGVFLFFDYYEISVDSDQSTVSAGGYDDINWARVDMRFGASWRVEI